jgi:predicted small secreted protein
VEKMKRLVILVLALLVTAGCQTMTGKTLGQSVDDTTIVGTVKAKLAAERLATLTRVDVDSVQGVVYLTGVVPTPADRVSAEQVARSVGGVRGVVNQLTVQSAGAPAAGPVPAASPSTIGPGGTSSVVGQVTRVDPASGRLTLRTQTGSFDLVVPPSSLTSVRVGDIVRVDTSLAPVR